MADFVAHDLLGEFLSCPRHLEQRYEALFRWGLQGPDLFFYYRVLTGAPLHTLGNRMHDQHTSPLLAAMARFCAAQKEPSRRERAEAYFYGFLGHYGLDSVVHPYVFHHQYRLAAKRPGEHPGALHCRIEADMDIDLYSYYKHQPISRYDPRKGHGLDGEDKEVLGALLSQVIRQVYGLVIAPQQIAAAADEMLRVQRLLYSGSHSLRRVASVGDLLLRQGGVLRAHVKLHRPQWDSLNLSGRAWRDPSRAEQVRTDSVPQLMEQAAHRAQELIDLYSAMIQGGQVEEIPLAESFSQGYLENTGAKKSF